MDAGVAAGALLIGDVGQNAIEEVDLMRPTDGGACRVIHVADDARCCA